MGHSVTSKAKRARPSAEQLGVSVRWSHVVQGGVSSGTQPPKLHTLTGYGVA